MKRTFYVWSSHLDEFLRWTKRRKKRDSMLMFFFTQKNDNKIPVTLTWTQPEKRSTKG